MRFKRVNHNQQPANRQRWPLLSLDLRGWLRGLATAGFSVAIPLLAGTLGSLNGYSQSVSAAPEGSQQPASPWSKPFPTAAPATGAPARVRLQATSDDPATRIPPTAAVHPVALPPVPILPPSSSSVQGSPAPSKVQLLSPVIPGATAQSDRSGSWNRVPALGIPLETNEGASATASHSAAHAPISPPALPIALPDRLPAITPSLPPAAIVRLTPAPNAASPTQENVVRGMGQRRIQQGLPDQEPIDRLESATVSNVRSVPDNRSTAPKLSGSRAFPSSRLLFSTEPPGVRTPAEWQPVEWELRGRLERCDAMLKRNAIQSAREEVLQALRILVRQLEVARSESGMHPIQQPSLQSRTQHPLESALQQALVTLDECPDFHETIQYQPKRIERIVEHHLSTALKGQNLSDMTNERARDAYLEHAKKMFVLSSEHHPWAAELLYALAKTYEREIPRDSSRASTIRSQSIACLESAYQIAPNHSYIANELGFSLIQAQRLQDAQSVLLNVVATEPSAPAWRNLAEVYRRRGASQDANQALERAAAMENR